MTAARERTKDHLARLVLRRMLRGRGGQALNLSVAVAAEEGDEGGIFDYLVDAIEEPKWKRLAQRHRDDEMRHALLYRACLDRLGLDLEEIPGELRIVRQVADLAAGGFATAADRSGDDRREQVARLYALLLAIEERGVATFPDLASAWCRVDPATARTYLEVTADEERHVRYCRTIGPHYAASDAAWAALVAEARANEAEAFDRVRTALLRTAIRRGLLATPD